jgi:hypothetical protein
LAMLKVVISFVFGISFIAFAETKISRVSLRNKSILSDTY